MADVKISQLPAATTPLTGAELVPVVQGGTTKKTTTSDVLAVPITSLTASSAVATDANKKLVSVANTGTGDNVLSTSPTLVTPALGTPSALVGTNITGTAAGLTAGNVTTNANLTGAVTSVGNATSLGSFSSANLAGALTDETGSGSAVFATSPTLVTPILGTPQSVTLTNGTGLPISTGVSGLGTGVATALGVNVGTAGSPVVNGGALGTPSSGTVTNLTGTANITVTGGASGAIAATTLSASGAVTLSGGTANGVAYLDGSKVLTTGSALTFDGTNLGIGVLNTNALLTIAGDKTGLRIERTNAIGFAYNTSTAATSPFRIQSNAGPVDLYTAAGQPITFSAEGSEQMRLTSTGLGIGTSSPAYKLDVNISSGPYISRFYNSNASTNQYNVSLWGQAAVGSAIGYIGTGGSAVGNTSFANNFVIGTQTSNPLVFNTVDTERMRLDASGNLGLGVTPSAWGSGSAAFQNSAGAIWRFGTDNLYVGQNYYYNGSSKIYSTNNLATEYQQAAGQHRFFTAPSGTAGNAITFTQAMTLTAGGNLLVGSTSTPASGSANIVSAYATGGGVQMAHTNSGGGALYVGLAGGGVATYTYTGAIGSESYSERARIDSSGNLLVGTTSAADTLIGIRLKTSVIDPYITNACTSSTSVATSYNLYSIGAAAYRFYVDLAGTIYATSTAITAISDQRLKENVRDIDTGLGAIMALKPRRFDWKAGKGQDKKNATGFIAQEFGEVFPASISTFKAGEKDANEYLTINHEELIPSLVKAIQEQQALITSLIARVAALEPSGFEQFGIPK